MAVMVVVMIMVVVMMIVVMIVNMSAYRAGHFRQQFFFQRFPGFHGFQDFLSRQLRDGSGNKRRFVIQLPQKSHAFLDFLRFCLICTAQNYRARIFDLITEEFSEVLPVYSAFCYIHNGCKAVEFRVDFVLYVLNGLDHVRQLAHTGRLNKNPVRMIGVYHFAERFSKIAYKRAADTAGIHFPDLYAGLFQKAAVNADFTELVFNQHNLLPCKRFRKQFFNQCCFSGSEEAGNNINLCHVSHPPALSIILIYLSFQVQFHRTVV